MAPLSLKHAERRWGLFGCILSLKQAWPAPIQTGGAFLDGWTWPHSMEARGRGTCPPLLQPIVIVLFVVGVDNAAAERPAGDRSPSGPGGETRTYVQRCRNNNRRSYYYKELIRAGAAGAGNKNKTIPLGSRHHPPRMIIQRAGRHTSKNSRTELRRADGNPPPHHAL
jgi:hypothetical protein